MIRVTFSGHRPDFRGRNGDSPNRPAAAAAKLGPSPSQAAEKTARASGENGTGRICGKHRSRRSDKSAPSHCPRRLRPRTGNPKEHISYHGGRFAGRRTFRTGANRCVAGCVRLTCLCVTMAEKKTGEVCWSGLARRNAVAVRKLPYGSEGTTEIRPNALGTILGEERHDG